MDTTCSSRTQSMYKVFQPWTLNGPAAIPSDKKGDLPVQRTPQQYLPQILPRLFGVCMNLYDDNPHVRVFSSSYYVLYLLYYWSTRALACLLNLPKRVCAVDYDLINKPQAGQRASRPDETPRASRYFGNRFSPRSSMSCSVGKPVCPDCLGFSTSIST